MKRFASSFLFFLSLGLLWSCLTPSTSLAALEVVTLRSGQVGGVPGTAGAVDDIVNYKPGGNPGGSPLQATPFVAADFAAAQAGPDAVVINPVGVWTPGISDPLARWINFAADPFSGQGNPSGSALYAVPFTITSATIPAAFLYLEGAVDDGLGDVIWGGPNPDGLYINGFSGGGMYSTMNFGTPTTYVQNISGVVSPGLNYLYFYQRDQGFGVSGLIFSARIEIVPEPSSLVLTGLGVAPVIWRRVRYRSLSGQ